MKNVLVFAGSNSSDSINKQLAEYAASLLHGVNITILDLNHFELPIYSKDLEASDGIPENAHNFFEYIKQADAIVLSLAENNGAYAAVFKNLFDWMSRIEAKTFLGKPMLLMATSPGGRGGQSVLEMAKDRFPRHDAQIVTTFSLPKFQDNFSPDGLKDTQLQNQLNDSVTKLQQAL